MPNVNYNPFIASVSGTIKGATFGKNNILSSKGGRASNHKKKSPAQLLNIQKTNTYRTAWNQLTIVQKRAWSAAGSNESVLLRLSKNHKITGHNLFIKCCFNACIRGAAPLSDYVAPTFYPIPANPCSDYTLSSGSMPCNGFVSMPHTVFMNIGASKPLFIIPSVSSVLFKLIYPPAMGYSSSFELGAYYRTVFGTPPSTGYFLIIRTFFIDSLSGFASPPCYQIVNVV
jgi:hypothetical protein